VPPQREACVSEAVPDVRFTTHRHPELQFPITFRIETNAAGEENWTLNDVHLEDIPTIEQHGFRFKNIAKLLCDDPIGNFGRAYAKVHLQKGLGPLKTLEEASAALANWRLCKGHPRGQIMGFQHYYDISRQTAYRRCGEIRAFGLE
jgi:hypothetical protein